MDAYNSTLYVKFFTIVNYRLNLLSLEQLIYKVISELKQLSS